MEQLNRGQLRVFLENAANTIFLLVEIAVLFTVGYVLIITFLPYIQELVWIAIVFGASLFLSNHVDGEQLMQNMDQFMGVPSATAVGVPVQNQGGEVRLVEVDT